MFINKELITAIVTDVKTADFEDKLVDIWTGESVAIDPYCIEDGSLK